MSAIFELILAERARAEKLHPDDHVGHPGQRHRQRLRALQEEVAEVAEEMYVGPSTALAWELIQVAGIAVVWVEYLLAIGYCDPSDLFELIEEGTPE